MRRIVPVAAALGLLLVFSIPSRAEQPGPDDAKRERVALKRDADRLKAEVAALKRQVEELKKGQHDLNVHVEMLLKHRHQLFLDFMRADAFFPKAKGTFFVITPSPDDLTKTSGPIAAP